MVPDTATLGEVHHPTNYQDDSEEIPQGRAVGGKNFKFLSNNAS